MGALKITGQSAEPTVTASDAGTIYYDSTAKVLKVYNGASWENLSQDDKIRQDVTTLALRQAIGDNAIAYNLPNSFIDQFEDDSGVGTFTRASRNAAEYVIPTPVIAGSTITRGGAPIHSTGETVGTNWGNTSISVDGMASAGDTGYLLIDHGATKMAFLTDATTSQSWTVDFWVNYQSEPEDWKWTFGWGDAQATNTNCLKFQAYTTTGVIYYGLKGTSINDHENPSGATADAFTNGTWYHMAFIRDGTNDYMYQDGVQKATHDISEGTNDNFRYTGIAMWDPEVLKGHDFYFDDFRISDSVRWPSGSSFSVPTARAVADANTKFLLQSGDAYENNDGAATDFVDAAAFDVQTGEVESITNVPSSAQTKVSGVMLYKDHVGTATLGTDIIVSFTCNGGTNWTDLVLADMTVVTPVFSTGIKMVKLAEKTCTSGSDIRYKVVWANQSAGVKETQLHGIGLNY